MKLLANNIIVGKQVEVEFLDHYDSRRVEVRWNNHNFIVYTYDIELLEG